MRREPPLGQHVFHGQRGLLKHGFEQRALVFEMPVNGTPCHARSAGNVGQCGVGDTFVKKHLLRSL